MLHHKCLSFSVNLDVQTFSLRQLIEITSSYVSQLRVTCNACMVWRDSISIADIAALLVKDKKDKWTLAIDLSVYSRNQQFRCFDCVKIGKKNPLIRFESFNNRPVQSNSYSEILLSSLITHNPIANKFNVIRLEKSESAIGQASTDSTLMSMKNYSNYLHDICPYVSNYTRNSQRSQLQHRITRTASNELDQLLSHQDRLRLNNSPYHSFVRQVIASDPNHCGFIRSFVFGSKNNNMIFFNIGGNYRYCTKKGTHHLRNSTAIIVDTHRQTYAIRCKDPECDNSVLTWNRIDSLP